MRVRLLIDVVTDDLDRLQRYVGEQPIVRVAVDGRTLRGGSGTPVDHEFLGRFVGAQEAHDAEGTTA